jgi:hypothetical protein
VKLRLVREDGTPATIEDFAAAHAIEVDGITAMVADISAPSLAYSSRGESHGSLRVTLSYPHHASYPDAPHGWGAWRPQYSCPFFWRAWDRQQRRDASPPRAPGVPAVRFFLDMDRMMAVWATGDADLAAAMAQIEGCAFLVSGAGLIETYRRSDGLWERRIVYATRSRVTDRRHRIAREERARASG